MAKGYKGAGARLRIASASENLTGGTPVVQEGIIGVVFGDIASGAAGEMTVDGVWNLTVPSGTVKGDLLYVPGAPATEDGSVTLTKTSASNTLFGIALSARDTANKADVKLFGGFPAATVGDTNAVLGLAAGVKVTSGTGTLDGGNPTGIATGLATVTGFTATLKGTGAPGVGTSTLTADISGATVNVYAWKPTSVSNPTLIASTGTEEFYWIAVGT